MEAPEGMKWCSHCQTPHALDDFHRSKRYRDGRGHTCKLVRARLDKERDHYQRMYGISRDEYEQIKITQGNRCASCGDELVRPHLDHCHRTDKIRGVLCHHCNVALGMLKDDPYRVMQLLMYIGGE